MDFQFFSAPQGVKPGVPLANSVFHAPIRTDVNKAPDASASDFVLLELPEP